MMAEKLQHIRLRDKTERDAMQEKLKEAGIPSMVYYAKGLHQQGAFKRCKQYVDCPKTELACGTVLSLLMHPYMEDVQSKMVWMAVL